jgi:hypothetical protein
MHNPSPLDISMYLKELDRQFSAQCPAQRQNEIRSIDWLSRSPDTLIRVGRPAPSDQQLTRMQAVVTRFLARLARVRLDTFRRSVIRQIQSHRSIP